MKKKNRNQKPEHTYLEKERIMDKLKFPSDVLLGDSVITIIGQNTLLIENYNGILDFDCDRICLQGKNCEIMIIGKQLAIDYYNHDDMKITGYMEQILFCHS